MNHDEPLIRSAQESDLPQLAELAGIIWRGSYVNLLPPDQIDYMLQRMYAIDTLTSELRNGVRFELLFSGENAIGFASFSAIGQDTFKLHKLYVHQNLHGSGHGYRLLRHCENEVLKAGARRLTLNVNKRNDRAVSFYRRNGFEVIDSVVIDIGAGFVMDDFVMAKTLGDRNVVEINPRIAP